MPIVRDYSNHADTLIMIEDAQSAEQSQRLIVKESKIFITETDGQWDQHAIEAMDGRFRGTFDMCTPIVDGIAGEMAQADFSIRISPSGMGASVDTAKTLNGLIRNIRNISNAEKMFNKMGRSNVVGGFDAIEIVMDWVEGDSFEKDLLFKEIANASDSVWFDQASIKQDRSDANWAIKLVTIPRSDYDIRWPGKSGRSIGDNSIDFHQEQKNTNDVVTVGQLYFKKLEKIEIVQMTDGAVYKVDEDFEKVQDELANPADGSEPVTIELDNQGEEKRRMRNHFRVHSRMLDGDDWLDSDKETVFDFIPICPIYGNYDIIDNSYVYFGKIKNLFDSQRGFNYSMSRDIEDGALGTSEKIVMTTEQIGENDYTRLNTERDPILEYDHQEGVAPPHKMAGHQPSNSLQTTSANMKEMINVSSNTFQAQQGNAVSTQSGVAGFQQIEQGNIGSIKWFKDLEIMLCYAAKVLINAIPRVYGSTRQVRILEEDNTSEVVTLNKPIFDTQTNTNVILNDLSVGEYNAVCEVGPAFNSSQKETQRAFEEMSRILPEFAQIGIDIWAKNLKAPGMDLMAERFREQQFKLGVIPQSQWTDDERAQAEQEQAQAAEQDQQQDPNFLAAQGQFLTGQADLTRAQTEQQVEAAKIQLEQQKLDIKSQEIALDVQKFQAKQQDDFDVAAAKIDQGQQKIDQDTQKILIDAQQNQDKIDLQEQSQGFNQLMATQEAQAKQQQAIVQMLQDQAETLKILREASGVDAIVGPGTTATFINQSREVIKAQQVDNKLETPLPGVREDKEPESALNNNQSEEA